MNPFPQQTGTVAHSQCRVAAFYALLLAHLILISTYFTLSDLTRNNGLSLYLQTSSYTGD